MAPRQRAAEATSAPSTAGESYGPVKAGDTLSGIARTSKPGDVSLDQMLVALFKSNPQAFAGKNMNRLKTGTILRMPDPSEVAATGPADASKEVKLQAANWNAYRQQLAASAPATPDQSPKQDVSGRISASVEDKVAGPLADDVLRLSKADRGSAIKTATGGGKTTAAGLERMKALEEELTSREKALQEANERVQMLEKSVNDMQRLLEIKSAGGAQVQNQSAAKTQPPAVAAPAEPSTEAAPATAAKTAEPAAPVPAAAESAKPEPQAAAAPKPKVVAPPPAAEPTVLESITSEPLYLAGGAGGLALLGALAFVKRRRRSKDEPAPEQGVMPLHEATSEAVIEPIATPVAPATPVASDEMGAVEEATKYLALGRDAQAEEVLKEALKSQPAQPALLLKLLEVFASRKDKRAFQSTAQELFAATGGSGEVWLQAAHMGHGLDPENPVYITEAPAANVGTASDLDFDLDLVAPRGMTETDITVDAAQAARELERTQMMGEEEARQAVAASGTHRGVGASAVAVSALTTTDFDLDAGQPAASATSTGFDGSKTEAGSLDINFDLPPEALSTSVGNHAASEIKVDLQKPATTPTSSDILDFDLSGISLDLDGTSTGMQSVAATPLKNDHWFDVQTKFDLAKAYQEMGDKESAREILKEVIAEGDAQQQAEAKSLLEALA
ncbi:MAG: FimV/HubP family polar landmark protein [Burkholderiales bacterium]